MSVILSIPGRSLPTTAKLYEAADRNGLGGVFEMTPAESPSTTTAESHSPHPPVAIFEYKFPTGPLSSPLLSETGLCAVGVEDAISHGQQDHDDLRGDEVPYASQKRVK
jgi:hypothetical protein